MSFLSKLKSSLGKISLKRKPGGTFVGNMLRSIVSKQTDGAFGTGAMMQQDGETTEQANDRMVKGLGAAASAFSDTASQGVQMPTSDDSHGLHQFKAGVITEKLKQYAPIGAAAAGLILLISLLKNRK